MKGWIIYSRDTLSSKFGNNAFDWMVDEAANRGLETEIVFEEDITISENKLIVNGVAATFPKFALLRTYCIEIAKFLENNEVMVFNNAESLVKSRDKWKTYIALSQKLISQPKTLLGDKNSSFNTIAEELGLPFVLKELEGSKGEQVYLIDNEKEFIDTSKKCTKGFLIQQYIQTSHGVDIRVYIVGNKVVGAVKRSSKTDFRSNYSLGGSVESYPLSQEVIDISLAAFQSLSLDFAGVDLLITPQEFLVCEVNAIPGFRTLSECTDVNLPGEMFNYISRAM